MKHFLIFLVCLTTLTACLDEIDEKPAKPGKAATEEEMADALDKTLAGITILDAKEDQHVVYEENYRVENSPVLRTFLSTMLLTKVEENDDSKTFYRLREEIEYDRAGNETNRTVTELDPLRVSTSEPELFAAAMSRLSGRVAPKADENPCDGKDETDSDGDTYDCIRYFNLSFHAKRVHLPDDLKCYDLPDCMVTVRVLSYDTVKWRKRQVVRKLTLRAEVAPEIPDLYFNADGGSVPVLSLCISGLIDIPEDDRDYFVNQCKVLRDFSL